MSSVCNDNRLVPTSLLRPTWSGCQNTGRFLRAEALAHLAARYRH